MLILLLIVAVIGGALAWVAARPNSFRLERSIVINTLPQTPFAFVNDFHNWTKWSPFENADTDLKRTYGGAPSGVGATYAWEGKKTGMGNMEILEATEPQKVAIKLNFIKPFPATNNVVFSFDSNNATTKVTWTMTGPMRFINKAMTTVMPMEKMLGPVFDQGLASLKAEAERAA